MSPAILFYLILAFFQIFPILKLLHDYFIIKVKSYLLAASLHTILLVDMVVIAYYGIGSLVQNLLVLIFVLIFYVLIYPIRSEKTLIKRRVFFPLYLLIFIYNMYVNIYADKLSEEYILIKFMAFDVLRMMLAYTVFIVFIKLKTITNSKRITFIKLSWSASGLIVFFAGIYRFSVLGIELYKFLEFNDPVDIEADILVHAKVVASLSLFVLVLVSFLNSVFLSEFLLISSSQVDKLKKAVTHIKNIDQHHPMMGEESLIKYINQVKDIIHNWEGSSNE